MVALEQFVHLQKKLGGKKINWWQLERKDMVVDMEKSKNMFRWFKYAIALPNWK